MLLPDPPARSSDYLAHWLYHRVPSPALYELPFETLIFAFIKGKTIKLIVRPKPNGKTKVDLCIEK